MSQGFPGAKICPTCGKTAVIDARQCSACGHVYRTKFPPPQPLNQTIGFPGVPLPGAQPPAGINPQNVVNVDPYAQPLQAPMVQRRSYVGWIVAGSCLAFVLLAMAGASLLSPSRERGQSHASQSPSGIPESIESDGEHPSNIPPPTESLSDLESRLVGLWMSNYESYHFEDDGYGRHTQPGGASMFTWSLLDKNTINIRSGLGNDRSMVRLGRLGPSSVVLDGITYSRVNLPSSTGPASRRQ